jgi:hypothetical protein
VIDQEVPAADVAVQDSSEDHSVGMHCKDMLQQRSHCGRYYKHKPNKQSRTVWHRSLVFVNLCSSRPIFLKTMR